MPVPITSRFSLRSRLAILIATMLIILSSVAWLLYGTTADRIERDAERQLFARATALDAELEVEILSMIARMESVASQVAGLRTTDVALIGAELDRLLADPTMVDGAVRSIVVIDASFVPMAVRGHQPELATETMSVALNGSTIGNTVELADGDIRLIVAGPVPGVGMVATEQGLDRLLQELITERDRSDTSEAFLVRRENTGIQYLSPLRFEPVTSASSTPHPQPADAATELSRKPDYRSENAIIAASTIESTGWELVVKVDEADAFGAVRTLRLNTIRAGLLTAILGAILGLLMLVGYGRRLNRIRRGAEAVSRGELDEPINDAGTDHLGRLANVIDRMAVELSEDRHRREAAEAELEDRARRDNLTGLPNRSAFMHHLEGLTDGAAPQSLAVLFCDLDGFKAVNDGMGHNAGDHLLQSVAERFRAALRRNDQLARFGGDEFILVCPTGGDVSRPKALAARLEAALDEPIEVGLTSVDVSASIGLAFNEKGDTADLLVRNADIAMYRIKEQRKAAGSTNSDDRLYGASGHDEELRRAIEEDDQLRLQYQPIVDLSDNRIVGVEALVRWHHPMLGLLNPRSFMARADRSGLLPKLDFWVFERSCRQLSAWALGGRVSDDFTMSINIAPAQLSNPGLRDHIARVIERYDVDPGMIQIEITEHSLVTDDVRVTKALRELKEQGLRLAIDDFGTLHANLDRVRNVPADALKIDMSFVANIVHNSNDRAIVTAVLNLSSALDLKTVAEGIETQDQADVLTELGCGFGQGFLFGNPRSPDATAHLLAYGLAGIGEH